MNLFLKYFILSLSVLSPVLGIIFGWKKRGLLWLYCWIALIADLIGVLLLQLNVPRFWNSNLFILIQFILISIYILRHVTENAMSKGLHAIVYGIGALFVIDTVRKSISVLNYDDGAILYILLLLLVLWAFHTIITRVELLKIERSPFFVFSCGFLLYISGTLIMLVFKKYIDAQSHTLMASLWIIHNVLNVIKNAAIAYALFLSKTFDA